MCLANGSQLLCQPQTRESLPARLSHTLQTTGLTSTMFTCVWPPASRLTQYCDREHTLTRHWHAVLQVPARLPHRASPSVPRPVTHPVRPSAQQAGGNHRGPHGPGGSHSGCSGRRGGPPHHPHSPRARAPRCSHQPACPGRVGEHACGLGLHGLQVTQGSSE